MRLKNAVNEQFFVAMPPQYMCITQGKEFNIHENPIKLLLAQTKEIFSITFLESWLEPFLKALLIC